MVTVAGVYLRADVDDDTDDGLLEQPTVVRLDSETAAGAAPLQPDGTLELAHAEERHELLTFVDLYHRTRRGDDWSASLRERLTARIQDRLHHVSSTDCLLIRWPWIAHGDDNVHRQAISDWLKRLAGADLGEPVISPNVRSVGILLHRIGDEPVVEWTRQRPAHHESVCLQARALELGALLKRRHAVWLPSRYHYRLPSGEHTDMWLYVSERGRRVRIRVTG